MVMDHIRIDPFTYIVTLGGKFNEPLVSESFLALFLVCVMLSVAHNVLLYDNYYNEFEDAVKKKKTIEDIIPKLKKIRDSLPEIAENDEEYHKKHQVIAVNGYWYNVKGFLETHPGGPIIKKFVGADVTSSFYGIHRHPDKILSKRTPIARVKIEKGEV